MPNPQLCYPYDGKPIKFPVFVEPKFDGFRALCVNGKFFSRLGKPLFNVNHIGDLLGNHSGEWVYDGELIDKDWNQTASVLHTQVRVEHNTTYHVFDSMPLHEWSAGICLLPFAARRKILETAIPNAPDYVRLVQSTLVRDWEGIELLYQQYLAQGFEGVVIKDPTATYKFRRHKSWMKFKPHTTGDYKVLSVIEGTGKYVGMLGALIVDVNGMKCGVGTGFDDKQRMELWTNPPIGQIAEVRYQEKTKDGVLRFPSFLRFRPDLSS